MKRLLLKAMSDLLTGTEFGTIRYTDNHVNVCLNPAYSSIEFKRLNLLVELFEDAIYCDEYPREYDTLEDFLQAKLPEMSYSEWVFANLILNWAEEMKRETEIELMESNDE